MENEKRLLKLEFELAEATKKIDQLIKIQEDRVSVFYNKFSLHEKQVSNDIEKAREGLKAELMELGRTYVYVTSFFVSIVGVVCGYLYLEIRHDSNVNAQHIIEIVDRMQKNKSE